MVIKKYEPNYNKLGLSLDKLNEAGYFYDLAKEKLQSIKHGIWSKEMVVAMLDYRYLLNAYINASRAVTFTLQSELKSKFPETFPEWYATVRERLKSHEFSGRLIEMRNRNQKQGNHSPIFLYEIEDETVRFEFTTSMTNTWPGFTINKTEWKHSEDSYSLDIPVTNVLENPFDDPKFKAEFIIGAINHSKDKFNQIGFKVPATLSKLIFIEGEEYRFEYTCAEFEENLRSIGKLLVSIVDEAKTIFQ